MVRVMHVISGLDQGGAEAMLVRLLRGLDRASFSQSVVSLTTRGVYGDQVEALGIPLVTLGMTGFRSLPRALLRLRDVMRGWQPNVVQTWLYHADLLGLAAARSSVDAAVAWNIRCSRLGPESAPPATRLLIRVLAEISASPDAVLFNSTAGLGSHQTSGYRPRRVEVIPNGFDLEEYRSDPMKRADFRAELGVDDDAFLVGMIARAHRMKSQSTFLSAAGRLRGMSRRVRFVLVGLNHTWSNASLVADIDQYGLRGRIDLLGLRQDVPRIMAGLDCLVSTSTSGEGFPNVIGEAMACGVPCVATDSGDSRLIIGDTGTVLPIGDVAGVVTGVSQLISETPEERRTRSERCRGRIVAQFELGQIARRYAEFYVDLYERRTLVTTAAQTPAPTRWFERFQRRAAGSVGYFGAADAGAWKRRLRNRVLAVVALYALVFHSPLVWAAGQALVLRQAPRRADAIVVFSGNGESAYINESYQRRARDAARYYKEGYAPLLIISSGITQTFAEVDIIRALLLSQGVPPQSMHIVTQYPRTTHENVEIVDAVLKQRGLKSILFITAPYHSRRASMIWSKLDPDVRVTTVPVVDTPPVNPQWAASVDEIRAISYEYLAIVYNRAKGWL